MTEIQKLQVRASKLRSEVNTMLFQDGELTDEQREELTVKRSELDDLEERWRIAVETHPDPTEREQETRGDTLTPEQIEFAKLEDGVQLAGAILGSPNGRTVEYRQETGIGNDRLPWLGFLDVPERVQLRADAYSEAPATGTAVNVQAIVDRVTAQLAARRLGVTFPVVPRGTASWQHVSSGVTPVSAAKGATVNASAWTLTPVTAGPKRIQVRVAWRREDAALVASFEDALRREARAALEESIDRMCINSYGSGNDLINGLNQTLTRKADLSSTGVSVGSALRGIADVVDGKYASDLRSVKIALGVESYRELVSVLTTIGLPQLAADLGGLISDVGSSVFTTAFIPAPTADSEAWQDALIWSGRADHVAAVSPVWEDGLTAILDPYSGASKGEIYSDLSLLTNFAVVDAAAYSRRRYSTS